MVSPTDPLLCICTSTRPGVSRSMKRGWRSSADGVTFCGAGTPSRQAKTVVRASTMPGFQAEEAGSEELGARSVGALLATPAGSAVPSSFFAEAATSTAPVVAPEKERQGRDWLSVRR